MHLCIGSIGDGNTPVVPLVYETVTILNLSISSSPGTSATGPGAHLIPSSCPQTSRSDNSNTSTPMEEAHWSKTLRSASGMASKDTKTRRDGHLGAILSNDGRWFALVMIIEIGQWFVLSESSMSVVPSETISRHI